MIVEKRAASGRRRCGGARQMTLASDDPPRLANGGERTVYQALCDQLSVTTG
jgi:hypothetical protein